jgi:STAS-like domain of unknown function (DUF4325)
MKTIRLLEIVGEFAEDKDAAAVIRKNTILPELSAGNDIEIDFDGVTLATQSFVHALISEAIRQHGEYALEKMSFKNCGNAARGIIETVVQYVMETLEDEG